MNIAVIGSGASAFGVLLRLKEELKKSDIKVTVFSKDLNYINNIFLENASITKSKLNLNQSVNLHKNIRHNFGHTFNEIKIENSNNLIYDIPYSGGLSDIWSGSAALPLDQDLKNWKIDNKEIEPYYKTISEQLPLSGRIDEINDKKTSFDTRPTRFVNSPPIKEHTLIKKLINKFNSIPTNDYFRIYTNYVFVDTKQSSFSKCINCQSCFSGCTKDSFFRPSKIINEWISNKIFSYVNDVVESLKIINNQYEILTKSQKKFTFDKVFLCAGPLNSAKIIINSFDYPLNDVYLYDIPTKFFPIISTIPKLSIDKKTFGFSTASGGIILKTDNYHHLLFGQLPKEYFKAKIGNNFAANALKNILNTFCLYGTIYGSNKDFFTYKLAKDFKLISSEGKKKTSIDDSLNNVIKKLKKILFTKGFLILNNFSIEGKSSSHYSSNLFNAYKIGVNGMGEFSKNLHICDTSTLGHASSSQPHTFFIMANSYRIANNAL